MRKSSAWTVSPAPADLCPRLRSRPPSSPPPSLFDQLDVRGAGALSKEEFVDGLQRVAGAGICRDAALALFEQHDTNRDGRLEKIEWTHSNYLSDVWAVLAQGQSPAIDFLLSPADLAMMQAMFE